MKKYSFSLLKIIRVVCKTTGFCFYWCFLLQLFPNHLLCSLYVKRMGLHHIYKPACLQPSVLLFSVFYPEQMQGQRLHRLLKMCLQTKFGREMFSVFFYFLFPKFLAWSLLFRWNTSPAVCGAVYLKFKISSSVEITHWNPIPVVVNVRESFPSVTFQTLHRHSSVLSAKLSWPPGILHWSS